jgi:hypothetical protein
LVRICSANHTKHHKNDDDNNADDDDDNDVDNNDDVEKEENDDDYDYGKNPTTNKYATAAQKDGNNEKKSLYIIFKIQKISTTMCILTLHPLKRVFLVAVLAV